MAINQAKEQGNTAYRNKDWAEAVKMYTLAIDVAASSSALGSESGGERRIEVCAWQTEVRVRNVRGLDRCIVRCGGGDQAEEAVGKRALQEGKALVGLERWKEAREAFELGLQFDPENKDLKSALAELPSNKNQL